MSPGGEVRLPSRALFVQPRRVQMTHIEMLRTGIYKSCCSCGLPIKTLIGGIGSWPAAPTRHNQRRKLSVHHHKATINTTCLQSRAPEGNLFRSRNPSRHASSWRARPTEYCTIVGCRRPVPEPVSIAIHNYCTKLHTLLCMQQ